MWIDIEATSDLLNFDVLARTAARLIRESAGQPISIGVSGNWGSGKSSFLKLVGAALRTEAGATTKYLFVDFNAWLYQGYEDARLALMQTVSDAVLEAAKDSQSIFDKALDYAKRVRWLKLAKLVGIPLASAVIGSSIGGPVGALVGVASSILHSNTIPTQADLEKLQTAYGQLRPELQELLKEREEDSMPKEIAELRRRLEEILGDLKKTLVVLVDDLDRCLPETAIPTLEAMRLLLFVPRTAFIIAADDRLIRYSVRKHFGSSELSEDVVTSYFDKLIQVPLRVPRLGTAEVKAYLVLLFAELATREGRITEACRSSAQAHILKAVRKAWSGGFTRSMLGAAFGSSTNLMARELDLADQLAPIMANADQIAGNPRLIKRFLNALMIRDAVAKEHEISVPLEELVKLLLLERCASQSAFDYFAKAVAESVDGKPGFLPPLEESLASGDDYQAPDPSWDAKFYSDWLRLPPMLAGIDLRPLIYLSRDKTFQIPGADSLSVHGSELLEAIIESTSITSGLVSELKKLGEAEGAQLLTRLFRRARADQWNARSITRCVHVTQAFPGLGSVFSAQLTEVPAEKRPSSLIPLIRGEAWAGGLLEAWSTDPQTPQTVKNAIVGKRREP